MNRDEVCSGETSNSEYYADAVSRLYKALGYISRGEADLEDISRWIDLTYYATEALTGLSTSRTLKLHEKKSRYSYLGHLKSIGRKLNKSPKTGGSLEQQTPEKSVTWDIIDTAFESRLKTAIITNLNHLDIQTSMQDASRMVMIYQACTGHYIPHHKFLSGMSASNIIGSCVIDTTSHRARTNLQDNVGPVQIPINQVILSLIPVRITDLTDL
ncbi:hypothetical protein QAD02_023859 [Eretmocerus hayati]|uniref:Uncharacterized protein n=1 Tax=Eretmocerus hayati TaxID=131215 RepID=A0ACC2PXR6_9HYME|nr:hypothetical protein QAD02_023859 [Eretmocerus hayati]